MIINGIDTKDISVVVQGAIDKENTPKCLKSIRKYLPEAEIILSTWEGSNVSGLDYDILVLNEDPLSFPCDSKTYSIPNNINRQLRSTQEGLKKVHRKYSVKFRTDFYLESNQFILFFDIYEKYNLAYKFFENRILISSIYTRNPRFDFCNLSMAYCPSDFFSFGLTIDIKKIYDRDLVTKDEDKLYFELYPEKKIELKYKDALCRYMPEQFIWIGFIEKNIGNLYCEHRDDINKKNITITEKLFANNFVIVDYKKLGINTYKTNLFTKGIPENCFTYYDWKLIYNSYCKKNIFSYFWYLLKIKIVNFYYKEFDDKIKKIKEKIFKAFYVKTVSDFNISLETYNYEYYSFDIFDTILIRETSPSWVPMAQTPIYITMLLKQYNKNVDVNKICELRNKFISEEYERNTFNGFDCEYEIYKVIENILLYYKIDMTITKYLVNQIVDNEVQREIDALILNNNVIPLLEKLKSASKKIIAISDMYLSHDNIVKILDKFSLLKYFDRIYVSSSYKLTKSSGRLFNYVLKDLNISHTDIIHIGNDYYSDVRGSHISNIDSLWYKNNKLIKRNKIVSDYILHKRPIGELIEKEFHFSNEKTYENYIKKLSVDINNFVFDLIIQSYYNNIECLYFLERDANIYKDILEILIKKITLFSGLKKIDLKNIKLSRKDTACLIDITNPVCIIERAQKVNDPGYFDLYHILGVFNISLDLFSLKDIKNIDSNRFNKDYFYTYFNNIFFPIFKERRKKAEELLLQANFFKYHNIGIVDIGWGGTIQKDLISYFRHKKSNVSLHGFYYACDGRIYEIDGIGKYHSYMDATTLFYGYSLLEFVVKEYTKNKNDLDDKCKKNPAMENTYKINLLTRKIILGTCEDFCSFVNKYSATVQNIFQYSNKILISLIHTPPKEFICKLNNVFFSLDRKANDKYIPLIKNIRSIYEQNEQIAMAQWVQGSFKLNNLNDNLQYWYNCYCIRIKKCLSMIKRTLKRFFIVPLKIIYKIIFNK